jgi:hypothetical protein
MTTRSELAAQVADLIKRRYTDRVAVAVSAEPGPAEADEIAVRPSSKSKMSASIRLFGTEFPIHVTLRYQPGAVRSSAEVTEEGVFLWGDEKLTAEGFVYRAFRGWFGGYQRYE